MSFKLHSQPFPPSRILWPVAVLTCARSIYHHSFSAFSFFPTLPPKLVTQSDTRSIMFDLDTINHTTHSLQNTKEPKMLRSQTLLTDRESVRHALRCKIIHLPSSEVPAASRTVPMILYVLLMCPPSITHFHCSDCCIKFCCMSGSRLSWL